MESLDQWFPNLKHVKSPNYHKISEHIEHEWIDVQEAISNDDGFDSDATDEQKELDILIQIIRKSIEEKDRKSIIVFAESKKIIDKICEALKEVEIKSLPYTSDIPVQGRALTLMLFQSQQLPVLVSNNVASRGLDTSNV